MLLQENHPEKGFTWGSRVSDLNVEIYWQPLCSMSVLSMERVGIISFYLLQSWKRFLFSLCHSRVFTSSTVLDSKTHTALCSPLVLHLCFIFAAALSNRSSFLPVILESNSKLPPSLSKKILLTLLQFVFLIQDKFSISISRYLFTDSSV